MPETTETIRVEVAYADETTQLIRAVDVPPNTTIEQAIALSKILLETPVGYTIAKVGIFGRTAAPTDTLRAGDRIELYRPLKLDPKEARRRRAAARK